MQSSSRETYEGSELILPEIQAIGWALFSKAQPQGLSPHVHAGAYEICFIIDGHVDWWVGDQVIEVGAGHIFITSPGEPHGGVNAVMHPNELYWLQVAFPPKKQALPGWDQTSTRAIAQQFGKLKLRTFPAQPQVPALFHRILLEHRQRSPWAAQAARAALHQLLIDLLRSHDEHAQHLRQSSRSICPRIQQSLRLIDQHIGDPLSLTDLADTLNMSVSHFRQRFVREVGISPGQYIVQQRVRRAKELLRDPRRSITVIANDLGFASSQHFATTFRQWVGLPPTEYRRSLGQPMHESDISHD